jgi:putative chitinase
MKLKKGSKGKEVKVLQEFLNQNGFSVSSSGPGSPGKETEIFGPATDAAVKRWQTSNGLRSDGVVSAEIWTKMFVTTTIGNITEISSTSIISFGDIKLEKLKGHVPDSVISQIPDIITKFNCNTPLRLAHFLAQCGHESGNFKAVSENLNYSAKGLLGTFSKYFNSTTANQYERKPEMIASKVYGGRMGNGDESTKDGWKFRGRGYIQLTGKNNYTAFTKFIGEDCIDNPDLVATKYPLASAAFFFDSNKLWATCDKGATDSDITAVTRRVNGGTIGLADRIKHFKKYYTLLK